MYKKVRGEKAVLDGVERWGRSMGMRLVREIKIDVSNRVDGILVPVSIDAPIMNDRGVYFWDRGGLIGVEVKVTRSDFLAGLRRGQFDRYDERMAGLYVAAPRGVVKMSELQPNIGLLLVHKKVMYKPEVKGVKRRSMKDRLFGSSNQEIAVCKRHPTYVRKKVDAELLWRVLFRVMREEREEFLSLKAEYKDMVSRVGDVASRRVFSIIRQIGNDVMTRK